MARRITAKANGRKAAAKSKKSSEAPAASAEGAPQESAPASVNKAKAVREALVKNPKGSPKEISAALKAEGVDVSPTYVSLIKWQAKQSKRKAKKTAPSAEAAASPRAASGGKASETITVESLIQAKKLAEALGGVEVARQALAALSRIMD